MTPAALMDKAARAVASAQLLLAAGDVDGACNRAYYGMFDAAKAALIGVGAPVEPTVAKTHSGLITAFSLHVIKPGVLPLDLGKALNRAAELRVLADYTGAEITLTQARELIEQATRLVAAVRPLLASPPPAPR